MNFFLFLITCIFVLSSCDTQKNEFINIELANNEIFKTTGIDIFEFRSKIRKDFNVDEKFYDSICYNLIVNNTNCVFEKYGVLTIKSNGDSIQYSECDSLQRMMGIGLSKGIILNNCSDRKSDSCCIAKTSWYHGLSQLESPIGTITRGLIEYVYYDLYKKGYLTSAELEFIVLWEYYLVSCQNIAFDKSEMNNKFGNN